SKQQTLGQQVARDPPYSRAQRDAQSQFLPPCSRPREQQIRHVHASDQQEKTDRPEQYPQCAARLEAYDLFIHGRQVSGDVAVVLRILPLQIRGNRGHLRLRLCERHALPQAADRPQDLRAALIKIPSLRRDGGYEFDLFRGQRELKTRRQNADNGERLAIQIEPPPKRRFGAAQAALPKLMADDDHPFSAALLFLDLKIASQERFDIEKRQEIGGHAQALQVFGLLFVEQNEAVGFVTRHHLKTPVPRAPILQI